VHFPKFWARAEWQGLDHEGHHLARQAWGWSEVSETDARAHAEQRARELAAATFDRDAPRMRYGYPDRPLREPVLKTIATGAQDVNAVITRNSYGCDVLNTDRILFIDVDLPEPERVTFLSGLFGRRKSRDDARVRIEADKIALLDRWQRQHPEFAFRVYRTAAGLRYLLVSQLVAAGDPLVEEMLASVDADANYRRLCRQQKSFRARLTPKPWRCGVEKPPHRFPFGNEHEQAKNDAWLRGYQHAAEHYAVCLRLLDIGARPVAPAIQSVLAEHDQLTRASANLPLA
jgi:hypothetical protein